jgi:hypothetical protein
MHIQPEQVGRIIAMGLETERTLPNREAIGGRLIDDVMLHQKVLDGDFGFVVFRLEGEVRWRFVIGAAEPDEFDESPHIIPQLFF